jgi:hypothetical protein
MIYSVSLALLLTVVYTHWRIHPGAQINQLNVTVRLLAGEPENGIIASHGIDYIPIGS